MKLQGFIALGTIVAASLTSTAFAADAVHKAKNLEWAKVGDSVFLADPAPLKDAKIGDKIKLVDASKANITGEGTIATAVVKQDKGVKTWVGWSVKVDVIRK